MERCQVVESPPGPDYFAVAFLWVNGVEVCTTCSIVVSDRYERSVWSRRILFTVSHLSTQTKRFSALLMQNNIVKRFNATVCARSRCFECNLRIENMISFGGATCLWSLKSFWILGGYTVLSLHTSMLMASWSTAELLNRLLMLILFQPDMEKDRKHRFGHPEYYLS